MTPLDPHHDSAPPAATGTAPAMAGFDAEFSDIVDYILRITYRIWEGKQVGLCYDYYSEDCPVYTLAGVTVGAAEVTQNTLATLSSFPDRTLEAVNIIWDGSAAEGYHSSHLISTHMTASGDSEFGPATQKNATILVIAHCIVKDNRIIEEWLVRDNYSLAEQLGYDPHQVAQRWAARPACERLEHWRSGELQRLEKDVSHSRVAVPTGSASAIICANLQNIWNARMVGDVFKLYSRSATMHSVAGRAPEGQEAIAGFYTQLLGTLSGLRFSVDYVCEQPNKAEGTDVALRWTLSGQHTGRALYGEPTGATLFILGESQYRVVNNQVVEEWTIFDELSVLAEVYRARAQEAL